MHDLVSHKILRYLERVDRNGDMPPTAGEIAKFYALPYGQVRTILGRMEDQGYVRKAGSASNGGRTWVIRVSVDG